MARKGGVERREQFVQAAQQLFYTKGYENTSVNDIISAVGVSKGAFYHHFDSKEAVLVAVVSALATRTKAIIQPILDDSQLSAIQKFNQMTRTVGAWKNERREELLAITGMMYSNDNIHLRHRLNSETARIVVPLLSQIFGQGMAEGVFDLGGIKEDDAAELVFTLLRTTGETAIYLLLDPNRPADAATIALSKYNAAQKMIERILDAPVGSLPLIDRKIFASWFV